MKTKLTDIMDAQAWEVYLTNRWQNFLPMITLWHIFQTLARPITLPELDLLISIDGYLVDCGKAGQWFPWKYVVLSPEFLRELREIGTLQAMETSGVLNRHRRGCFRIERGNVVFLSGTPYYRKVPKGHQPETINGERVMDPKLEAEWSVINPQSEIGRYINATNEWPMTHGLATFRRFNPRPVLQDKPNRSAHQGPKKFWVKPVHRSQVLHEVGVASSRGALRELEEAAFSR